MYLDSKGMLQDPPPTTLLASPGIALAGSNSLATSLEDQAAADDENSELVSSSLSHRHPYELMMDLHPQYYQVCPKSVPDPPTISNQLLPLRLSLNIEPEVSMHDLRVRPVATRPEEPRNLRPLASVSNSSAGLAQNLVPAGPTPGRTSFLSSRRTVGH
jgi:hypothetical protein